MKQDEAVQLFRQARTLFHDERYEEALALFERLEREHPENLGMWHAHAWCLARMGRDAEARTMCQRLRSAGDTRAADIEAYLDTLDSAQDRVERAKNPATIMEARVEAPQVQAKRDVEVYRSKSPRTWRAFGSAGKEPEPGGIRCARITLLVASGGGILALVFSFLAAAMVLQQQSAGGAVPWMVVGAITIMLTSELLMTCFAALAWQHITTGRIGLAMAAAALLLPVFPLGTGMGVLIILGVVDSESRPWLMRASAQRAM